MAVLFGDPLWHINMETREVNETRKRNGLFHDGKGPRNVVMSAVMHGYFGAWGFADRKSLTLVHHPFASKPMPLGQFPFCGRTPFRP
jgi:hypothetical protein